MMTLLDQPSKAAPGGEPAAASGQPDERNAAPDAVPDAATEPAGQPGQPAEAERSGLAAPVRWFLGALLLGAGAVHLAMAPSHLDASAVEGAGFLVAAWVQLLLAAALVLRPTRAVLAATAATNLVLIALWAVSRTAGLPFGEHRGHPESVSVVDGICVGLEAVALALVLALLTRVGAGLLTWVGASRRARRTALVGAVGALVLATGAVASPAARDHAAASHGDHGTGMAGHAHDDAAGGAHGAAAGDDLGFAELSNGHQHEHTTDEPLTPQERVTLANQLAATAELVERYPTLGDAEAAGWTRAGPFAPGLGTHYTNGFAPNTDGDMDPEDLANPTLVYDGLEPDAPLAGFMYQAYGTEGEPEGFAGPNDHWHYHESVCIKMENGAISTPFGADLEGVTERMCTDIGGRWIAFTGYMVHVWNVPGYESPDGMFTELNPKITCPDGTYHRIEIRNLGSRDTVCRNP